MGPGLGGLVVWELRPVGRFGPPCSLVYVKVFTSFANGSILSATPTATTRLANQCLVKCAKRVFYKGTP